VPLLPDNQAGKMVFGTKNRPASNTNDPDSVFLIIGIHYDPTLKKKSRIE